MVVQDLWYLKKRGPNKKRLPSKRNGRGSRWRVVVEDPATGETITEAWDDEDKAKDRDAILRAELAKGTFVDPRKARKTVAEYAEEWRSSLVVRESSMAIIERALRLHIVPVIGHLPMGRVNSGTVQAWVRSRQTLEKPLAAVTIRNMYHTVLFPMFARAVVDGVRGKTPCIGIKLPELPEGQHDLPTPEQVVALVEAMPEEYTAVPLLAAGCGWRFGEVFGLLKGDVDFLRSEVHVRHQLVQYKGEGMGLGPPKSRTSRRTNELPEVVKAALARHIARNPPVPVELTDRRNPDKPTRTPVELLFTDHKGRPMARPTWSRIWAAAIAKARLPESTFTLHSLRHFFATTLIFNQASVKSVQLACGHATPTITLNTYLGYWPGDERLGTRKLLDATLAVPIRTGSVPAGRN